MQTPAYSYGRAVLLTPTLWADHLAAAETEHKRLRTHITGSRTNSPGRARSCWSGVVSEKVSEGRRGGSRLAENNHFAKSPCCSCTAPGLKRARSTHPHQSAAMAVAAASMPARQDVTFISGKDICAAWLYPRPGPERRDKTPALILGHGLGGVREMRLDAYAAEFQKAGYTVVVFDYRYFGSSGGQPRQLLSISAQLQDWAAAIKFTRGLDIVDPQKVGIFGTSFGGGHVLSMAVRDPTIACAISQCPFTSGFASAGTVGLALPFIALRAILDQIIGFFTRRIISVKLAGKPGEVALMNQPDVIQGYLGLGRPDHKNYVAARIALWLPLYMPGWAARRAKIPIFVAICGKDSVAPPGPTIRYAKSIPRGEWKLYEDLGHFTIYNGDGFQRAMRDYLEFLGRHLPVGATSAP